MICIFVFLIDPVFDRIGIQAHRNSVLLNRMKCGLSGLNNMESKRGMKAAKVHGREDAVLWFSGNNDSDYNNLALQ